jgi:hypothetical protein
MIVASDMESQISAIVEIIHVKIPDLNAISISAHRRQRIATAQSKYDLLVWCFVYNRPGIFYMDI